MSKIYFLIRHTPFWAIPVLVMGLEFGYIFWLRKKKANFKVAMIFVLFALAALAWYFNAGSPEKAVKEFILWHRAFEF